MSNIENISLSAEKYLYTAKKIVIRNIALGVLITIAPGILAGRYIKNRFKKDRPMADKISSLDPRQNIH